MNEAQIILIPPPITTAVSGKFKIFLNSQDTESQSVNFSPWTYTGAW